MYCSWCGVRRLLPVDVVCYWLRFACIVNWSLYYVLLDGCILLLAMFYLCFSYVCCLVVVVVCCLLLTVVCSLLCVFCYAMLVGCCSLRVRFVLCVVCCVMCYCLLFVVCWLLIGVVRCVTCCALLVVCLLFLFV